MEELEGQTLKPVFTINGIVVTAEEYYQYYGHELWRTLAFDYRSLLKKYLQASGRAYSKYQSSREQCLHETGVEFTEAEWQELEKLASESE